MSRRVGGLVVIVAGVLVIVGGSARFFASSARADRARIEQVEGFERVVIPGDDTVTLGRGAHVIFHEYPDADRCHLDGGDCTTRPALERVTLETRDTERSVALEDYGGNSYYASKDHDGEAIYRFEIHGPGPYTLSASGKAATIAVGRDLDDDDTVTYLARYTLVFVVVLAGMGMCTLGADIRRSASPARSPSCAE